jgi:hypothetical protein
MSELSPQDLSACVCVCVLYSGLHSALRSIHVGTIPAGSECVCVCVYVCVCVSVCVCVCVCVLYSGLHSALRSISVGTIPAGSECAFAKMTTFVDVYSAAWVFLKGKLLVYQALSC